MKQTYDGGCHRLNHPGALTPLLFPPCKSDWHQALLIYILNIPFDLGSLLFHSAAVYNNIKAFVNRRSFNSFLFTF
jgi:hypothetical protein